MLAALWGRRAVRATPASRAVGVQGCLARTWDAELQEGLGQGMGGGSAAASCLGNGGSNPGINVPGLVLQCCPVPPGMSRSSSALLSLCWSRQWVEVLLRGDPRVLKRSPNARSECALFSLSGIRHPKIWGDTVLVESKGCFVPLCDAALASVALSV